jgi:hypothetical protein
VGIQGRRAALWLAAAVAVAIAVIGMAPRAQIVQGNDRLTCPSAATMLVLGDDPSRRVKRLLGVPRDPRSYVRCRTSPEPGRAFVAGSALGLVVLGLGLGWDSARTRRSAERRATPERVSQRV